MSYDVVSNFCESVFGFTPHADALEAVAPEVIADIVERRFGSKSHLSNALKLFYGLDGDAVMDYKEIAEVLGVSVSRVRANLSKATIKIIDDHWMTDLFTSFKKSRMAMEKNYTEASQAIELMRIRYNRLVGLYEQLGNNEQREAMESTGKKVEWVMDSFEEIESVYKRLEESEPGYTACRLKILYLDAKVMCDEMISIESALIKRISKRCSCKAGLSLPANTIVRHTRYTIYIQDES